MFAPEPTLVASPALELRPATQFAIDQLTTIYNQARVDYVVPMPMNAARLTEYIQMYDVALEHSLVALVEDQPVGIGMVGIRQGRAWITRLGVLPTQRRHGAGRVIVQAMLATADRLACRTQLEVIKINEPAHQLFLRSGFIEDRDLLVMRRPPGPPTQIPSGETQPLERAEVLDRFQHAHEQAARLPRAHPNRQSWITEPRSLVNADHVSGFAVRLPDGGQGWVIYQEHKLRQMSTMLSHLHLCTEQGEPATVGRALLTQLYQRYPRLDTQAENIAVDDPHLPAFIELGFIESFRRIEMFRPCETRA